jgi:acetyltransferase-like isoleucine patch superfamily enzyme
MKCVMYKILLWVERLFLFVLGPQGVRFNVEGFLCWSKFEVEGRLNMVDVQAKARVKNVKFEIFGSENTVLFGRNCRISNVRFHIVGNGHKVIFKDNVMMNGGCVWIEDSESLLEIGERSYIESANFALTGVQKNIKIGRDCLFSNEISFRTGDSHAIFDEATGMKVNEEKSITVADHVWLGNGVTILKGVNLAENIVVGTKSVVTKSFSANCVIGGFPAKVLKENVNWSAERFL